MRHISRCVWALVGAFATGCAGNTAPSGFLPTPIEAQSESYGGWLELQLTTDSAGRPLRRDGELLAVTADSVWLLTARGAMVIPTAAVRGGQLTGYLSAASYVPQWTALGVVSTLSNGLLLGITAPLWIITGSISGSNDSHVPLREVPKVPWTSLAEFARFPQGMPPGMLLESLTPMK